MATITILFNDSFGAGWSVRAGYKPGNDATSADIMATLTDGRLWTRQVFVGVDKSAGLEFEQAAGNPTFDAVGLVGVEGGFIGKPAKLVDVALNGVLEMGSGERDMVAGNNLFRFGSLYGFAPFTLANSAGLNLRLDLGSAHGSVAKIFVGREHRVTTYYPVGWQPPIFGGVEDTIKLSESGMPAARHTRRAPVEVDLPLKFLADSYAQGDLRALIERMRDEAFMIRFDDAADWRSFVGYCVMTEADQPAYISPGLVDVKLTLKGYFGNA